MIKTIALLALAISLFMGLDRFYHQKRSSLPSKITTTCPVEISYKPAPLTKELEEILSQNFTYFSKGSQAFVFLSKDKKYVLKFFKKDKLSPTTWLAYLPFKYNPYYQDLLKKRQKALDAFQSCILADQQLKQETGMVYLHISPSKSNKTLTLIDKKGRSHQISLDHSLFLVQKRAELIYPTISKLMNQGKIAQAKETISAVFQFLEHLGKKGVGKNDPIVKKNFGLLDGKAIQIDVGKLAIEPLRLQTPIYKTEIPAVTYKFKVWLEQNHPELISHFEAELAKSI